MSKYFYILAIIILVDTISTILFINGGATELNPLMATLIDINMPMFFFSKLIVQGAGLIALELYYKSRINWASKAVYPFTIIIYMLAYVSGIVYQIMLDF